MGDFKFVKNNKKIIRERLIRYNLKRGEVLFAKQIENSINILPNKDIKYDKNGFFISKAEKPNSITRQRLLNPLAIIKKNTKKSKNENRLRKLEITYTKEERDKALNDLNSSLELEMKAIQNSRRKYIK